MKEQVQIFLESSQQFLIEIATALPNILGALLILLIGWIIAKIIKKIFVKLLRLVKINYLTEKSGIEKFLKEGGVKFTAVDVIGTLIYWLIMLIVILASLNSLHLTSAQDLFNEIILFIPNIIVSIVILLLGIYIAKFVSDLLSVSLKNMKDKSANFIRRLAYYAIVVFTVFIVLGQLNIAQGIITSAFILFFGALCLAFGLAFGIGGKDYASDLLKELKEKKEDL